MNNDNFLIDEQDLELARSICSGIENKDLRNRAVANVLGPKLAVKYFEEATIDIKSGLHNVEKVLKDFDISDVYVNGSYVDVRLYFNDNEICVPKEHFERNILPKAYMFIKIDQGLTGALVTGFVFPNTIDTSQEKNGYYKVNYEDLVSYYDIEPVLVNDYLTDVPSDIENLTFEYLDNRLNEDEKNSFYKCLIESEEYREFLINASKAQYIFNFVSPAMEQNSPIELDVNVEPENFDLDSTSEELLLDTESDLNIDSDSNFELIEEIDTEAPLLEEAEVEMEFSVEENEEIVDTTSNTIEEVDDLVTITEPQPDFDINNESELDSFLATDEIMDIAEEKSSSEVSIDDFISEFSATSEDENNQFGEIVEKKEENQYSTNTTPSIEKYEESSDDILNSLLNEDDENPQAISSTDGDTEQKSSEEIEGLYGDSDISNEAEESFDEAFIQTPKKQNSKILPLIGFLAVIGALGYFGYTKFYPQDIPASTMPEPVERVVQNSPEKEAMPNETVENVKMEQPTDEGNAVSIPAIEQNLDASILVSNLSVNWEVPTGYISNTSAQRYLKKIGKIIQLNLKTELLLLSKQPITNKIAVELEFDNKTNKFNVKNITISSGEKTVDEIIVQTIKNALELNIKTNMSSFANIAGNPTLVIKL